MKFIINFCLLLFFFGKINCSLDKKKTKENLPYSYQTAHWQDIFHKIEEKKNNLPFPISSFIPKVKADVDQCVICNVIVGALLLERGFDMTNIQEAAEVTYFCSLLGISGRVCEGVINLNVESLGYIIDNQENVNSEKVCSLIMGCSLGSEQFEWTIDIPEGKTVDKVDSDGHDTFKIAHLTDIHYDPRYTEGKKLECGEPTCCQDDQAEASGDEASCGYWSSLAGADSTRRLVEATVDYMNELGGFDYVYFTGDLVAHRVWETSEDFNSNSISDIMKLFAEKFKVPVYPILGNHETNPVNVYSPINITEKGLSNQWLFDVAYDNWKTWLGPDVEETVKKGGYYTVSPKDKDGLRIIVLNNNVCQTENWWNLYDDYDPYGQLTWLAKTLKKAEDDNEIVHLLSHVPNASCLKVWGREFNKIIERFSNTIAAQFNGHTHRDVLHIFYDSDNNPNNIVINGGSLMPDKANPNFKIYTVDSTGYDVMDAELYTFDLDAANADKDHKIDWYKLYSYQEDFGVAKLTPAELDALVKKMSSDIANKNYTLINNYHKFYFRNSVTGQSDCDENCQKNYLCEIVTTVHDDNSLCIA